MNLDLAANLRDIAMGHDESHGAAALEQFAAPDAFSELIERISAEGQR